MNCPRCGTPVPVGARQCPRCGMQFDNAGRQYGQGYQPAPQQQYPQQYQQYQQRPANNQYGYQPGYGNPGFAPRGAYGAYGQYPQPAAKPDAKSAKQAKQKADKKSGGLNFISFLLPIIGLIIFLAKRKKKPIQARSVGRATAAGAIMWICLICAALIVSFVMFGGPVGMLKELKIIKP